MLYVVNMLICVCVRVMQLNAICIVLYALYACIDFIAHIV